jgi:hypothetical protein
MTPLTADDTRLLKEVAQFSEPVQVCDPTGKLLGIFVPAARERIKPHFDPEEIKRRLQEKPSGLLFSDLVQKLKELDKEDDRRKAAGEKDFTLEEVQTYLRSGTFGNPPSSEQ